MSSFLGLSDTAQQIGDPLNLIHQSPGQQAATDAQVAQSQLIQTMIGREGQLYPEIQALITQNNGDLNAVWTQLQTQYPQVAQTIQNTTQQLVQQAGTTTEGMTQAYSQLDSLFADTGKTMTDAQGNIVQGQGQFSGTLADETNRLNQAASAANINIGQQASVATQAAGQFTGAMQQAGAQQQGTADALTSYLDQLKTQSPAAYNSLASTLTGAQNQVATGELTPAQQAQLKNINDTGQAQISAGLQAPIGNAVADLAKRGVTSSSTAEGTLSNIAQSAAPQELALQQYIAQQALNLPTQTATTEAALAGQGFNAAQANTQTQAGLSQQIATGQNTATTSQAQYAQNILNALTGNAQTQIAAGQTQLGNTATASNAATTNAGTAFSSLSQTNQLAVQNALAKLAAGQTLSAAEAANLQNIFGVQTTAASAQNTAAQQQLQIGNEQLAGQQSVDSSTLNPYLSMWTSTIGGSQQPVQQQPSTLGPVLGAAGSVVGSIYGGGAGGAAGNAVGTAVGDNLNLGMG